MKNYVFDEHQLATLQDLVDYAAAEDWLPPSGDEGWEVYNIIQRLITGDSISF